MYYEEKVINNILHFRGTPNGDWQPCTLEILTDLLLKTRQELLLNTPTEA